MLRIRQIIGLNGSTVITISLAPTCLYSAWFSKPFSWTFAGRRPWMTNYPITRV